MKSETTSLKIRRLAGRILAKIRRAKRGESATLVLGFYEKEDGQNVWRSEPDAFTVDDVESLAQCAITQSPDRKKAKPRKRKA